MADRQFAIFYMRLVKPFSRNLYQNIRLSNEIEVKTIICDFDGIWGFRQAAGAIDGCHIRTNVLLKDTEDNFNRKDDHSIVLHRLVGNNYIFCDGFVRWRGNSHDARIFKSSSFY